MKIFLFFILLTTGLPSFAKIHIEPYIGYATTLIKKDLPSKKTISEVGKAFDYVITGKSYFGPTIGLRVGYRSLGLALGVDVSRGEWGAFNGPKILTPMTAGIFASYNLPVLFRAYGVLIPIAKVKIKNKNNTKATLICNSSSGVKTGLSYLSIPFLSINIEYQSLYINGTSSDCQTWSHTATVFLNFIF